MAKKKKKQNRGSTQPQIRLSQCVIVKNEEKNIKQCLSWGKGVVFEQIVVDTGSTDRTVEIAKRMGAKVFHFEWINDFAAAKNHALDQASGDWIAFLDADEYFPKESAAKLLPILNQITANPDMRERCLGICCPMHQLDDDGKTMDTMGAVRLCRNLPQVRWHGRIHEQLNIGGRGDDIIRTEDIQIMHTGYSESVHLSSKKSERNIEMIRAELKEDPDNLRMKLYLAMSLVSFANTGRAEDEKAVREEAEALYVEVATGKFNKEDDEYKKTAYKYLMNECVNNKELITKYDYICKNAFQDYPDDFRIACLYAGVLNCKEKHREAFELLKELEVRQENPATRAFGYTEKDMLAMCKQLLLAAQGLDDFDNVFKYTAAILITDKLNSGIFGIYLKIALRLVPNIDGVLELVGMMYDLNNKEEAEFVAGVAREQGAAELAERIENKG